MGIYISFFMQYYFEVIQVNTEDHKQCLRVFNHYLLELH